MKKEDTLRLQEPDYRYFAQFSSADVLISDLVHNRSPRERVAWWIIAGAYDTLADRVYTFCIRLGLDPALVGDVMSDAQDCLRTSIEVQWYELEKPSSYYMGRTVNFLKFCILNLICRSNRKLDRVRVATIKKLLEDLDRRANKDDLPWMTKEQQIEQGMQTIRECMEKLSKTNFAVWQLLLEDKNQAEVARILGRDQSDVSRAKSRSKAVLQKCMEKEGFEL